MSMAIPPTINSVPLLITR